ncbi:4-hydroxy-3-methylbut-2-enyl diphosphate reductase [Candidatus Omnitrophota bacterium]
METISELKKMQIKIAGHSGFCFGVKRAINIAETTLEKLRHKKNTYSLGPIIHNPQVVNELKDMGLNVIMDIDSIEEGTIIISSHGAPKDSIQKIKKKKIKLVDATCPFVKYTQDIVKDLKKKGYRIIIVGDKKHPEVKALISLAGSETKGKKIGIVSQTTQNKYSYLREILEILGNDFSEVRIFNTICSDTSRRQEVTRNLLKECDVMIVIGGKNSANTRRLYQICKEGKVDSYHIEGELELNTDHFIGKRCIGVVSGASTPDKMVEKVVERIEEITNNAYIKA